MIQHSRDGSFFDKNVFESSQFSQICTRLIEKGIPAAELSGLGDKPFWEDGSSSLSERKPFEPDGEPSQDSLEKQPPPSVSFWSKHGDQIVVSGALVAGIGGIGGLIAYDGFANDFDNLEQAIDFLAGGIRENYEAICIAAGGVIGLIMLCMLYQYVRNRCCSDVDGNTPPPPLEDPFAKQPTPTQLEHSTQPPASVTPSLSGN